MFETLSTSQRDIVFNKTGKFVVKACPGSGKTFSVSARIARLLNDPNEDLSKQGIAAISFTNVAWKEIDQALGSKFQAKGAMRFPHFLGTIDRFINHYIFLPHGHLVMECDKRPELVGEPHRSWTYKRYERDPISYFDKVSFGVDHQIIPIAQPSEFHFKWFNQDGVTVNGTVDNILVEKERLVKQGFANQSDANYYAMKLLQEYPLIGKGLANRFKYLIIDEAQDSTAVQNKVIDLLIEAGIQEVMVIGDPDQAIFEWNTASPKLFEDRYEEWEENSIILNENRRSSDNICEFTQYLSSGNKANAIDEVVQDFSSIPQIKPYTAGNENSIIADFLSECGTLGISVNKEDVSVLYRAGSFRKALGIPVVDFGVNPWVSGDSFTRDLIFGKILIEQGALKKGFKKIESAYWSAIDNLNYCSQADINEKITQLGFRDYRKLISEFHSSLPLVNNIVLSEAVDLINVKLAELSFPKRLQVNIGHANQPSHDYFNLSEDTTSQLEFGHGTIHSVKGETFEAVLLFMKKGFPQRKHYKTIIADMLANNNVEPKNKEEMRTVYVGITRPRKLLWLAVPTDAESKWKELFRIEN